MLLFCIKFCYFSSWKYIDTSCIIIQTKINQFLNSPIYHRIIFPIVRKCTLAGAQRLLCFLRFSSMVLISITWCLLGLAAASIFHFKVPRVKLTQIKDDGEISELWEFGTTHLLFDTLLRTLWFILGWHDLFYAPDANERITIDHGIGISCLSLVLIMYTTVS
jgi:hypothetical protein